MVASSAMMSAKGTVFSFHTTRLDSRGSLHGNAPLAQCAVQFDELIRFEPTHIKISCGRVQISIMSSMITSMTSRRGS